MVVVNTEEVVEISTHILCRLHGGMDVNIRNYICEWGKLTGQDSQLNLGGKTKVCLNIHELPMLPLCLLYIFNLSLSLFYCAFKVFEVNRLGGKVEGTIIHCLADIAHFAVCTNHNNLQGWVVTILNFLQKRKTIHLWHIDVRENYVNVWMLQKHLNSFQTIMSKEEFIFTFAYFSAEILS